MLGHLLHYQARDGDKQIVTQCTTTIERTEPTWLPEFLAGTSCGVSVEVSITLSFDHFLNLDELGPGLVSTADFVAGGGSHVERSARWSNGISARPQDSYGLWEPIR
ncbi:MAG: hypothetical protein A2289_06200 [Deltaproteobacteria bacterium RIFOXYA12_FULL_58_15]|nr:MAG: hypothetical protein A2289_06200 [Deltaproteobacteria bacterium RIFOXYA12_FULL_58_15]OGR09872.1 MAG: hypothetical protein A2341_14315 [Deltaproteobacteria bacterium RIFOXYB12_FULL_58_9]